MNVLHIADNQPTGIEEVELLANRYNKRNFLHVIKRANKIFHTGGFIFENTDEVKAIFHHFPPEKHYEVAKKLKVDPFVKDYFVEY